MPPPVIKERKHFSKSGIPFIVVHIYEVADQFGTRETYDCYSVCFDGTNEDELFKHAEDFYALTPYEEA